MIADQAHDEPDREPDGHLLGQHPADVAETNLADADGADQGRHRLAADIAADADDERDVRESARESLAADPSNVRAPDW